MSCAPPGCQPLSLVEHEEGIGGYYLLLVLHRGPVGMNLPALTLGQEEQLREDVAPASLDVPDLGAFLSAQAEVHLGEVHLDPPHELRVLEPGLDEQLGLLVVHADQLAWRVLLVAILDLEGLHLQELAVLLDLHVEFTFLIPLLYQLL